MRLQLLFLLLLVTSQLTLGQDEVESSGWSSSSNDDATAVGAENQERDLSTTEGEQEEEVDPYPELNWPRAGGAIFDPAGGMYLDATEVLVYSLMGTTASVHYTTDGSEPTNQSTTFETKIKFAGVGDYTVKACVSAPERRDSIVVEQVYRVRTASAAPSVAAQVLDPENQEGGNTTFANDFYLGSFEDGVRLKFYTSTPNSDIKFTVDGQDPTDDYGNTTQNGLQVVYNAFGNHTIKTKTFPRELSGFPSDIVEYSVEIHKRPPRPAYTFRREKIFLRDMEHKYTNLAIKVGKKVLNPPDLETYIINILNPDAAMCDDCHITDDEMALIQDATVEMKKYEGLSVDDELLLYPGFLMRGSCHRFIHNLNTKMREYRWKVRNGTGFLPSGQEHNDGEVGMVLSGELSEL
jgi:hypothetical protein|tara:strand:- start:233 stop:1456 length:1224 start_codon:yes stop_codon:yes gene_type:complete